jgi:cytochrome c oxidase assembly factor CtaG
MLQHVLIGDVAPALLVLGLRGPLAFFLVPARVLRVLGRRRAVRRALAWLLRPEVGFGVWALSLGLWHIPGAYDYALAHPLAHDVEHVSFMLGGLLVWAQLVDPARRRALSRSGRLVFALGLFAVGQALADVLILSGGSLYPRYAAVPERLFGLSALRDQQLAGLVMLVEQTLSVGACVAVLARRPRGEGTIAIRWPSSRAAWRSAPTFPRSPH